jgi:hypothetical protein
MSTPSKYEQFAWMAKYISRIKPADNWLEFELPPGIAIDKVLPANLFERLRFNPELSLTISFTLKDEALFEFLLKAHKRYLTSFDVDRNDWVAPVPGYKPTVPQSERRPSIPIGDIDEFNGDQAYRFMIGTKKRWALDLLLTEAVYNQDFEHAAMIRDEIKSRK